MFVFSPKTNFTRLQLALFAGGRSAVRAVLASGFVLDYWRLHHAISMFHMLFYCVRKYVYEEYRE
ncbi:hypothetical protein A8E31_33890 [Burkholderia cenocepacia]|nr:hypothetical protein A8E31_33890 [Burkholderia cenocepacia]